MLGIVSVVAVPAVAPTEVPAVTETVPVVATEIFALAVPVPTVPNGTPLLAVAPM
jgi:hypothetical protein